MKKPKLYKWDYVVVAIGLAFMFGLTYSAGFSSLLIVGAVVLLIAAIIYFLKLAFSQKSMETVEKFFIWLKKFIEEIGVYIVLIGFVIAIFWFGFKLIGSLFQWLKTGYWGLYDYDPACNALGFSCLPMTDYVKINEFLYWINHFDVSIFLFFSIIALVLAWAWIIKILKSADE